jgi:hypothetical protein
MLQLRDKFGALPDGNKEKVMMADLSTLEKWSLRLMKAETLNAVFDS